MARTNPDTANLLAALDRLQQRGLLTTEMPVLFQGQSNGCGFSSRMLLYFNPKAFVCYINPTFATVVDRVMIPMGWALMSRDKLLAPDGNNNARAFMEILQRAWF